MAFQLSKDGVPCISFNNKPKHLYFSGSLHRCDFFWVEGIDGLAAERSSNRWWDQVREAVDDDVLRWEDVYESMSRFECRMEVKGKRGATWLTVPGDSKAL